MRSTLFVVQPGNGFLCGTYPNQLQVVNAFPKNVGATLGGTFSMPTCPPPPPPPPALPPPPAQAGVPPEGATPIPSGKKSTLGGGAIAGAQLLLAEPPPPSLGICSRLRSSCHAWGTCCNGGGSTAHWMS